MKPTKFTGPIFTLASEPTPSTPKVRFWKKKNAEFSKKELESALDSFRGRHLQSVPAFSAVKIEGKRAYHLARQGKVLKMPKREVEFLELELEKSNFRISNSNSLQQRDLHPIIGGRSWIQTESRRPPQRFGAAAMRKAFSAGRHMQPGSP